MSPARILLALVLALTTVRAPAETDDERTLRSLQYGVHPNLAAHDFAQRRRDIVQKLDEFRRDWVRTTNALLDVKSRKCTRFARLVAITAQDLSLTLASFEPGEPSTREEILLKTRGTLLVPLFFGLNGLFRDKHEGGLASIAPILPFPCFEASDRAPLARALDTLSKELSTYQRDVLGAPGLVELDEMQDAILVAAAHDEASWQRVNTAVFIGGFAASWAFASFATIGARVALAQFAPDLSFLAQSKVSTFTAAHALQVMEALAWFEAERHLRPSDSPAIAEHWAGTWEDLISEGETFTNSRTHAPALYLAGLTQFKAQIARLYEPWLKRKLERGPLATEAGK